MSAKKKSARKKLPATKSTKLQRRPRAKAVGKKASSSIVRTPTAPGVESRLVATVQPTSDLRSVLRLTDESVQTFTGNVRISGNESALNGTLLIRAGVSGFANAVVAATQYLINEGIEDDDQISVVGELTTVTNDNGQPVEVIVMISATKL